MQRVPPALLLAGEATAQTARQIIATGRKTVTSAKDQGAEAPVAVHHVSVPVISISGKSRNTAEDGLRSFLKPGRAAGTGIRAGGRVHTALTHLKQVVKGGRGGGVLLTVIHLMLQQVSQEAAAQIPSGQKLELC